MSQRVRVVPLIGLQWTELFPEYYSSVVLVWQYRASWRDRGAATATAAATTSSEKPIIVSIINSPSIIIRRGGRRFCRRPLRRLLPSVSDATAQRLQLAHRLRLLQQELWRHRDAWRPSAEAAGWRHRREVAARCSTVQRSFGSLDHVTRSVWAESNLARWICCGSGCRHRPIPILWLSCYL